MEVLVLGRPGLERSTLERFLAAAGHEVGECHDRHWGCVGMDGVCPLDDRTIDVAIACVEAGDRFDPQGVACVYRAKIALVTVGATAHDPVLPYATIAVDRADGELLDAIESIRAARRTPDVAGDERAGQTPHDCTLSDGTPISRWSRGRWRWRSP